MNIQITQSEIIALLIGIFIGWILFSRRSLWRNPKTVDLSQAPIDLNQASIDNLNQHPSMLQKTDHLTTLNTSKHYVINGVTYNSLEEMPESVRKEFEEVLADKDGNGIPDILEKK